MSRRTVSGFPKIACESSGDTSIASDEIEVSPVELECFFVKRNLDLQRAAMKGNWGEIKNLLGEDQDALNADISGREETVLFTAAMMGHADVVEELLKKLPPDSDVLVKQNKDGETVLHAAAAGESLETVKKLVEKNPRLTQITNNRRDTPLMAAVGLSNGEIVRYLCKKTRDTGDDASGRPFSGRRSGDLITNLIYSGHYALTWIKKLTWKAMTWLVPRIKEIEQEKLKHRYSNEFIHIACEAISKLIEEGETDHSLTIFDRGLYKAAENGIIEIITICFQHFPTLVPLADEEHRSIFHRAIEHRREKILNLLYVKTAYNKVQPTFFTKSNETYLHVVAKLAPYPQLRSIPCPAIQMQREIQWFKAIEKLTPSYQRAWLTEDNMTADQLFTTEHKKLVEEAERWMKDTSNSCMLVSTLIATVVFAAAFTVPGGNLEGKGTPIFIMKEIFMVFAISDALALFSSITSVLMFLSILTARYAEQDFLYALPKRLIFGLSFLFIAIAAMMVAFGSALQIMLNDKWEWFHVPIMLLLGALPVVVFMMLQVPLFAEMVWSTYGPSIFRPQRIW